MSHCDRPAPGAAGTRAADSAPAAATGPLIRLQRPELPDPIDMLAYYQLSRDAGFYSNGGPCARLLTERLEQRLGGVHVVPVGNCTAGLMVALRAACGRPTGRRRIVLTPSWTFTATACAIEWAGFEPVFVDVEPRGWHMDGGALESALAHHAGAVAGVLACATFGSAPAPEIRANWRSSCAARGVPLLVDSAPGFGACDVDGRALGTMGDTEIFSFHATKPFAIGEGGIVTTPDPDVAAAVARLVNFGLETGTRASAEVGINGKMSELHAATGLAMLDSFDEVLAARRGHAARLRVALEGTGARFQEGSEASTWQILPVSMPTPRTRERLIALAPQHGVEVRTMHDPPLHRHAAFSTRDHDGLPITDLLAERAVALPMANTLTATELERIVALVGAATAR